jgi:hypothetical protein
MLLLAGVMIGCLNAWYWVRKSGSWSEKVNEEEDE